MGRRRQRPFSWPGAEKLQVPLGGQYLLPQLPATSLLPSSEPSGGTGTTAGARPAGGARSFCVGFSETRVLSDAETKAVPLSRPTRQPKGPPCSGEAG